MLINYQSGVSSIEVMYNLGVLHLLLERVSERQFGPAKLPWVWNMSHRIMYSDMLYKKQEACPRLIENGLTCSYTALRV